MWLCHLRLLHSRPPPARSRRRFHSPFGLADQRKGLPHLVAVHRQIIQCHRLRFFPFGFRFQIGRHVRLFVKVFAAHAGKGNDPPFAVGLQRSLADAQRKAHVLRVDSATVRPRGIFAFQLPRLRGQRFQFPDEGYSYLLVDADCIHNVKF